VIKISEKRRQEFVRNYRGMFRKGWGEEAVVDGLVPENGLARCLMELYVAAGGMGINEFKMFHSMNFGLQGPFEDHHMTLVTDTGIGNQEKGELSARLQRHMFDHLERRMCCSINSALKDKYLPNT